MKKIEKVLAYILRKSKNSFEVLVFEHVDYPEAGIQVPAGTVLLNESLNDAVLREVREETGIQGAEIQKHLGCFEYFREDRQEMHMRNVYQLTTNQELPTNWIHHVISHDEDNKLKFKCYWMTISSAQNALAAEQGAYIHLVK